MQIFDKINTYIMFHADVSSQLEFFFRIKFWCLLIVAIYFLIKVSLPNKDRQKDAAKEGKFLA